MQTYLFQKTNRKESSTICCTLTPNAYRLKKSIVLLSYTNLYFIKKYLKCLSMIFNDNKNRKIGVIK